MNEAVAHFTILRQTADAKAVDKPADPKSGAANSTEGAGAGTTKDAATTVHEKADKNASIGAGKDKHSKDKKDKKSD